MSGVTMERSSGDEKITSFGSPKHASGGVVAAADNHHDDHDHHDAVPPLRESRPRSSRGLLRKDTPAILDTSKVNKSLLKTEVHHSPLVTEEEEDEDLENPQQPDLKHNEDLSLRAEYIDTNKDTVDNTASSKDITHCTGDVETNDCTVESNVVDSLDSTTKTQRRSGGGGDVTGECCDGTRPKCKPVNNAGVIKSNVRTESTVKTGVEHESKSAVAKGRKPVVTFKEKHKEGFHAHTRSGMKVLMRKETPASLPSVQKVKAAQRFRQTSDTSLTEEEDHHDVSDEDNDDQEHTFPEGAYGDG